MLKKERNYSFQIYQYNTNQRYKSFAVCVLFFHDNFTTQTMFELLRTEKIKDKMQQLDKYGPKRSTYWSFLDQNRQAGNDYFVLFYLSVFSRGGHVG